jgi:xanthine dehydrogenase YagR molybdenum-binding subunit
MEKKFAADPTSRVDGRLKVTGGAKYFAEFDAPKLSYCVLVTSTIARGKIRFDRYKSCGECAGCIGRIHTS